MSPSKPLTLRAQEVRDLLAGRCDVRRAVRPPVSECPCRVPQRGDGFFLIRPVGQDGYVVAAPFGPAGSEVWIRETWLQPGMEPILYKADHESRMIVADLQAKHRIDPNYPALHWVGPQWMPQIASRLTATIHSVMAERTERGWEWVVVLERKDA